jgi:Ca2+-binding EF-hand superfamily protein
MRSMIFLLPVALAASCVSPPATPSSKAFQRADNNSDGSVSRQEATDLMIADAFMMYDSNGDKVVDEAEFMASGGTAENFRKINKSGSGKITLEEAKSSKRVFNTFVVSFDEADTNKDGLVSYEEYVAYIARRDAAVR